jgi:hypothetical protein
VLDADDPELLYHYTDARGLLGILTSGHLWATEARYLNDASELDYTFQLFDEFVTGAIASSPSVLVEMLQQASTVGREAWRDDVLCFVACFCEDKDLLSQWRAYAHGVGGYAIGFKRREIDAASIRRNFGPYEFRRVDYDAEAKKQKLGYEFVGALQRFVDKPPMNEAERLVMWRSIVSGYFSEVGFNAPLCKSPGFKEEREWRVVSRESRSILAGTEFQKFRISPTLGLVPYVELDVRVEQGLSRAHIGEIVIGPAAHPDLTERSLRLLLASVGYGEDEVLITRSKVPLRA